MARKQTFKRRPNNAGTIVKLSGKRRKAYCAKVTSGYDPVTGNQIQKVLGTFETWEEADDALTLYRLTNKKTITDNEARALAPDTFQKLIAQREKNIPTFKEIFEAVYDEDYSKLSKVTSAGYRSWFKHFKSIWDIKISQITLADLQEIFDHDKSGYGTKSHMKTLCTRIFEYAVIHQHISRDSNYTEYIKLKSENKESNKHYAFTNDEIISLINDDSDVAKILLIYIFTGVRANELLNIQKENIHIDDKYPHFITGSKTKAGRNRIIPIHPFIEKYVKDLLLLQPERIIDCTYQHFIMYKFKPLMKKLDFNHTMHDTRDTFATLCQINNVDIFARKRILGHKFKDITFDTYTSTVLENLYNEITKIKVPKP